MNSVETAGRSVIVTLEGIRCYLTASDARWLGEAMISRANDLERDQGPTPTGLQHIAALKALTDEVTQ